MTTGVSSFSDLLPSHLFHNGNLFHHLTTALLCLYLYFIFISFISKIFNFILVANAYFITVDSLVAVEVRNLIFRRFKADISIFDILSSMPLTKLAVKIVSKSQYVRTEVVALALEDIAE